MTHPSESVYPSVDESISNECNGHLFTEFIGNNGITKREYFAALAMQGLLADHLQEGPSKRICKTSVMYADNLIEELNKTKDKPSA
jgi:hypothetical protein